MTTLTLNADAADLLDGAADVITEWGWCQNRLTDAVGRVCVVGAMTAAARNDALRLGLAYGEASAALRSIIGRGDIVRWNNTPGRTAAEVVQAFRDAAVKARPDAMRVGAS